MPRQFFFNITTIALTLKLYFKTGGEAPKNCIEAANDSEAAGTVYTVYSQEKCLVFLENKSLPSPLPRNKFLLKRVKSDMEINNRTFY